MTKNLNLILKLFIIQFFTLSLAINSKPIFISFEGCIADSNAIEMRALIEWLEKNCAKTPSLELDYYRSTPLYEILEKLDITDTDRKKLVDYMLDSLYAKIESNELKPTKNIHYTLKKLKQFGHEIILIAAANKEWINKFLINNNLSEFFEGSILEPSLHGNCIYSFGLFTTIRDILFRAKQHFRNECNCAINEVKSTTPTNIHSNTAESSKSFGLDYVTACYNSIKEGLVTEKLNNLYLCNSIEQCHFNVYNYLINKIIILSSENSFSSPERIQKWINENQALLKEYDKEVIIINSIDELLIHL